jgi:predicted ATPase
LRRHRAAAHLTQQGLAERAGLSVRGIADLERGARLIPHPDTLRRLVEAFDLGETDRARLADAAHRRPQENDSERVRLPVQLTSFIGREHELGRIRNLLGSARLLTLTGFGGVGKTRLAVEVARASIDEFPDGIQFAELAPIGDARLVPHTVATAVGARELPQEPIVHTLVSTLRDKRALLIMDNCEHLASSCAELADTLLRTCDDLRILATSREPLAVGGETVWQVRPLNVPPLADGSALDAATLREFESVRLFAERARDAMPEFELTPSAARAVALVCVRLEGIALAIELAAARVRLLTPEQMAARLNDRLRLLAGGSRTAPARHQAMRAAIDWSYELLSNSERTLLQRLSVFIGGWTLEAAEGVCGAETLSREDVMNLLGRLVDRSLVLSEPGPGVTARYRLLETVREYAAERLREEDEAEAVSRRHAIWFTDLACAALDDFWWGVDLLTWLDRLSSEQANFRSALQWSIRTGDAELGLRLAGGLWVLWSVRGAWDEGRSWLAALLALPGASQQTAARADAVAAAGQLAFTQGEPAASRAFFAEAVDLQRRVGSQRGLAMAATHVGLAMRSSGEYEVARGMHEEGVALARAAGNQRWEGVSLAALAHNLYLLGEFELARKRAQESVAIARELSQTLDLSIPVYVLGRAEASLGDPTAARRAYEETLTVWRETGDARSAPWALAGLASVAIAEGSYAEARKLLDEAVVLSRSLGSQVGLFYTLETWAMLAAAQGRPAPAFRLAGAAAALRSKMEHPISRPEQAELERWLAPARAELGDTAVSAAWAEGRDLTAQAAVAYARTLDQDDLDATRRTGRFSAQSRAPSVADRARL